MFLDTLPIPIHRLCALAGAGCLLAACLLGCGNSDSGSLEFEIAPGRAVTLVGPAPRPFATSAERFGLAMPAAQAAQAFRYELPEGWSALPPTTLRALNFRVDPGSDVECYLTLLGGDGGGELANVNRWCGQLGAPTWSSAELAAATRIPMLGGEGILVALEAPASDKALLGAMARHGARSVFVKLTGAKAQVAAQRSAFEALCGSLASNP